MNNKTTPSLFAQVWEFFGSLQTAIVLLIILAVVSLLGTLIEQNADPLAYARAYNPALLKVIYFFGLTGLYSQPWFYILLALLGISISVCSVNRIAKLVSEHRGPREWGSLFTHLSVLIIFLGAIYGMATGFSDNAAIVEGETYREPHTGVELKLVDYRTILDGQKRVKSFESDLVLFEGGKKILEKTIRVNDPLSWAGVTFYQSSYGVAAFNLEVRGSGGGVFKVPMGPENTPDFTRARINLPGTSVAIFAHEFYPDLAFDYGGNPYAPSNNLLNPAAYLYVNYNYPRDKKNWKPLGWLTREQELTVKGFKIRLGRIYEYTGLQVKKDPGVPLVWLGCILLTIGVIMTSYFPKQNNRKP